MLEVLLEGSLTKDQVGEVLRGRTLGKRLALLRRFRGASQGELADRAGVSQTMISKLENDELQRPSFESIHNILRALEVPDIVTFPLLKGPASNASTLGLLRDALKGLESAANEAEANAPPRQAQSDS